MDMKTAEDAFVFYRSFFEAMEGLPDEHKLALFDAIARMGLYGEETDLPLEARRLFVLILPQLRANRKKRAEGRKGGRPPKADGLPQLETSGFEEEKENEKEKEKEKENEKEKETESVCRDAAPPETPAARSAPRTLFVPPSLEDIESYCQERGNRVNAQRFMDFYTANGWRLGRSPMKDWQAAVRSWETNGMDDRQPAPPHKPSDREVFLEALEIHRRKEAKLV